ncbi:condensation domain-containing protein [Streptomyces sp. NPDC020996]|uniref:condensation domain-containing protein n=1 Tax=Streptomyces sp. NPDC020996 TaxID=3154791 RepID=UPI0033F5736F
MAHSTVTATEGHALSVGQEALWFLHALAPESSAYNTSAAVELDFDVDVAALRTAVLAVVAENSMLNCLVRTTPSGPRRLPGAAAPYPSVFEVLPAGGDDGALHATALAASRRPFRLDREPPVRVSLLLREQGGALLVVTAHHIAVDNPSQGRLCRDLLAAYGRVVAGAAPVGAGADRGAPYAEFVGRERDFLQSPRGTSAARYWRDVLEAVPHDPPLAGDLPRPEVYRFAGDQVERPVPAGLVDRVQALAADANTTPFAVLLAGFQLLLYALSGEPDRLIGYPASLRSGRVSRTATGHYVNTLPLAARVEADDGFAGLLRRTADALRSGLVHRAYPFALMPRLVDRPRSADRAGLIGLLFVVAVEDDGAPPGAGLPPGHAVRARPLPQQQGQFDLTVQLSHRGTETVLVLRYNTSLLSAAAARTLADGYLGLLTAAVDGALPERLGDLASTLRL